MQYTCHQYLLTIIKIEFKIASKINKMKLIYMLKMLIFCLIEL
jgi:hypothetical protein